MGMEMSRWKSLEIGTGGAPLFMLFSLVWFICLEYIFSCEVGVSFWFTLLLRWLARR